MRVLRDTTQPKIVTYAHLCEPVWYKSSFGNRWVSIGSLNHLPQNSVIECEECGLTWIVKHPTMLKNPSCHYIRPETKRELRRRVKNEARNN